MLPSTINILLTNCLEALEAEIITIDEYIQYTTEIGKAM